MAEARELARHTDVRQTMKYTHVGLEGQAKAVNLLPALKLPAEEADGDCLLSVSAQSGADGQAGAEAGADRQQRRAKKKRRNPSNRKGYGAVRQPVARNGKNRQGVEAAGIECECRTSQPTRCQRLRRSPFGRVHVWATHQRLGLSLLGIGAAF